MDEGIATCDRCARSECLEAAYSRALNFVDTLHLPGLPIDIDTDLRFISGGRNCCAIDILIEEVTWLRVEVARLRGLV